MPVSYTHLDVYKRQLLFGHCERPEREGLPDEERQALEPGCGLQHLSLIHI